MREVGQWMILARFVRLGLELESMLLLLWLMVVGGGEYDDRCRLSVDIQWSNRPDCEMSRTMRFFWIFAF